MGAYTDVFGRFTGQLSLKDYGDRIKVISHKYDVTKSKGRRKSDNAYTWDWEDDSPPWPTDADTDLISEIYDWLKGVGETIKRKRLEHSVSRARTKIMEYGSCNDWDYFVTFTLNPAWYNRYDLKRFMKDFTQVIRDERKNKGYNLQYLLIPEMHKNGAWHIHGFFKGVDDSFLKEFTLDDYLPYDIRQKLEQGIRVWNFPRFAKKFGWCSMEKIKNRSAAARYITKYISKDVKEVDSGYRLYYVSRGLNVAQLLFRGQDERILAHTDWMYENDWCKINWFPKDWFQEYFGHLISKNIS